MSIPSKPPPVIQSTKRSPRPSNPGVERDQRSNPVVENFFKGSNPPIHLPVQDLFRWGAHMDQCKLWVMVPTGTVPSHQHPENEGHQFSSDNSTLFAYVNKQGGTRSVTPMKDTYLLFHPVSQSSYLLGTRNVTAHSLSRQSQILQSELSFHPIHHPKNSKDLGLPNVGSDCHQRQQKTKPLAVSPVPDNQAWAEDALPIELTGVQAYA